MTNLKRINREIDLIFCIIVLPLLLSIIPIEKMFTNSRIFTITLVLFLYCTYFIIRKTHIPMLIMKKRFLMAGILILFLFTAASLLAHFPFTDDFILKLPDGDIPRATAHRSQRVWFLFLAICGFSLSIDLTFELFNQVITRKEAEYAKDKAELSLYKAQINPHFLFNSLNTIYGMIVTGSDRTEDAFVYFTDMLKYMYDYPTTDKVTIRREMEYIENYIRFQTFRYGSSTTVLWNHSIDDYDKEITPMIMITFVENAFKYGASSSAECKIEATATLHEGHLFFEVSNSIVNHRDEDKIGIGIENCRNRLNLLYPERHSLEIQENGNEYRIILNIDL